MPDKSPQPMRDGDSSSAIAEDVIRPARLSFERYSIVANVP